jgi:teichuronic acid biosynthesis glycosyltransferase TuaC
MITSEWPIGNHPEQGVFVVQQVKDLRKANVAVTVFPFRGNKNPVNYLKSWWSLRRQHDFDRFDLIHAQFGQSGLLALPARVPMVVTFHGSDLQGDVGSDGRYTKAGMALQLVSRYIASRAKEIIVVSEHLKYLLHRSKVHVIPCGVDLDLFRPIPQLQARKELGLPSGKPLVLFAALNPENPVKRYALAQQAVTLLKSKFDVELITVCRAPHESMPLYMNACDVMVLTSKHEGSSTVVKEGLACNLPVVSVDVGDVREIYLDVCSVPTIPQRRFRRA